MEKYETIAIEILIDIAIMIVIEILIVMAIMNENR